VSPDIQDEIVKLLTAKGETVAAAESCTGGGILASLTSVPGSSAVVWGGIVTYSNEAKVSMLDVDNRLIERDGAVSSGVAKSMAWGMRIRSGADWTIAVTGVAGPGGGTQEKPVGTVWIAWCDPTGVVSARLFHIDGNRDDVRRKSVEEALTGLRQLIFDQS
jgi:nicotinamide-nucleotide amidase